MSETPRGVYVHVPWCRRRCPYCDFYFEVGRPDATFAAAIAREFERRADELAGPVHSLSFGGGTPSLLDPAALGAIVDAVGARLGFADDAELSLEANPEDISPERIEGWRAAGIDRVSLGVQSFDDDALRFLGRVHRGEAARAAIAACARAFRVGADLIVGVPGDRPRRALLDVDTAVEAGAEHVSSYLLTVEADTPLDRLIRQGRRDDVDEDGQVDAYQAVAAHLERAGLRHYEVSSWARPGAESRHNRLYWSQGSYLGLGPGAHSMRLRDDGSVARRHTTAPLAAWLPDPAAAAHDVDVLPPARALREALAFGLRDLVRGVDPHELAARHRSPLPAAVLAALEERAAAGHVVREGGRFRLTEAGALFADGVARDLLEAG